MTTVKHDQQIEENIFRFSFFGAINTRMGVSSFAPIKDNYIKLNAEVTGHREDSIDAYLKDGADDIVTVTFTIMDGDDAADLQLTLDADDFKDKMNSKLEQKGNDFLPGISKIKETEKSYIEEIAGMTRGSYTVLFLGKIKVLIV